MKGLENKTYKEWLRELELSNLERKKKKKRRLKETEERPHRSHHDGMQGNSLKFFQGRIDFGNNFFMERVIRHRDRLPKEAVESPGLEVCKRCGHSV